MKSFAINWSRFTLFFYPLLQKGVLKAFQQRTNQFINDKYVKTLKYQYSIFVTGAAFIQHSNQQYVDPLLSLKSGLKCYHTRLCITSITV